MVVLFIELGRFGKANIGKTGGPLPLNTKDISARFELLSWVLLYRTGKCSRSLLPATRQPQAFSFSRLVAQREPHTARNLTGRYRPVTEQEVPTSSRLVHHPPPPKVDGDASRSVSSSRRTSPRFR